MSARLSASSELLDLFLQGGHTRFELSTCRLPRRWRRCCFPGRSGLGDKSYGFEGYDRRRVLPALWALHAGRSVERWFGVLAVATCLCDVSAVEPNSPSHDHMVWRLEGLHQLPSTLQCLPPSLCHLRISSYPREIFLDLLMHVLPDPFQVCLPPVIPASELVILQRDTTAPVFHFAHLRTIVLGLRWNVGRALSFAFGQDLGEIVAS